MDRVVGLHSCGTLFASSNINFIQLESSNLLVDHTQEPCSCTDTSGFDEKDDAKHNVDIGVGKEGHGEGRSNQLPRDGGKNGGDDSSKESQVEELLDTVRNAKDVVVNTNLNIQSGDTGNDEKAKCDGHLTTDHESGLVASHIPLEISSQVLRATLGILATAKKPNNSDIHAYGSIAALIR